MFEWRSQFGSAWGRQFNTISESNEMFYYAVPVCWDWVTNQDDEHCDTIIHTICTYI